MVCPDAQMQENQGQDVSMHEVERQEAATCDNKVITVLASRAIPTQDVRFPTGKFLEIKTDRMEASWFFLTDTGIWLILIRKSSMGVTLRANTMRRRI